MGGVRTILPCLFSLYIFCPGLHVVTWLTEHLNWLSVLNYAYNKPDPFLVGGAGHETKYGHAASYCMK